MRNNTICLAIQKRMLLRLTYGFKHRLVEPHAYGVSATDKELLRAWQHEPTPMLNETKWKLFEQDKATDIQLTEIRFEGPRPDYKRDDPVLKRMYERL